MAEDQAGDHGCGVTHDDIFNGRYMHALGVAMKRLHSEHQNEHLTLIGDTVEQGVCHMSHIMGAAVSQLMAEMTEGMEQGTPMDGMTPLVAMFQAGVLMGRAMQEMDSQAILSTLDQDGLPTIKAGINVK